MKSQWLAVLSILLAAGAATAQQGPDIVPDSLAEGGAPEQFHPAVANYKPKHFHPGADHTKQNVAEPGLSSDYGSDILGWVQADYLFWRFKDGPNPSPLVTTGPGVNGSPPSLQQSQTRVLFGAGGLEFDFFSGIRVSAGYSMGDDSDQSFEANAFFTEQRSAGFSAGSHPGGSPSLARPFISAADLSEQAFKISFPSQFTGRLDIRVTSQLCGAELNGAAAVYSDHRIKAEILGGFRFMELEEDMRFAQQTSIIGIGADLGKFGPRPTGFGTDISDVFTTENRFYGGQLGIRARANLGKLGLDLTGKIALGSTHQKLRVEGETLLRDANSAVAATASGGFLAEPTNSGTFERNRFTVIPEFGLNASYVLGEQLRLTAGYSFLYWDTVFRPGDQIDRTVNISQVAAADAGPRVGPARPAPVLKGNDFWAQGISLGIQYSW